MKIPRLLLLLAATTTFATSAADWPGWRGPRRDDHSPDTGLLKSWPAAGPKRLWTSDKGGAGYAGFSVSGGKLLTMGLRDETEYILAFDAETGRELWAAPAGTLYKNNWGDGPRGTPTIDGDRVYAMGGRGVLACVQLADGKPVWTKSMTEDLGGKLPGWGYTESVLVHGDLILCTPGGEKGTMAALKKSTGEIAWRTTTLTDGAHYSSSISIKHGGKDEIVQLVEKKFFGVDPANGNVLWQQPWTRGNVAVIPTPIFSAGHVFITSSYKAGCTLVKLGDGGSVSVVYDNPRTMQNHHGGVILVDGHLYGHSDAGGWLCLNFLTGEQVWASTKLGKGAVHYADGMLYCLDEKSGDVALVEASTKGWNEKGRFKLEPQSQKRNKQGGIWTHPVVVNGRLYLRDQEFIVCLEVKG